MVPLFIIMMQMYVIFGERGKKPWTNHDNVYDYVIVGGGFSGLYTAYRLGQSSDSKLKIAIVERDKSDYNWQNSGLSKNGIHEIFPSKQYEHACLGGRVQDFPYQCKIDPSNNPHCPSSGYFPGIVWYGDHAVRYKTTQGNFFLAKELGFQQINDDPYYTYGEAQGFMGHDRGYYFMDPQDLLDDRYDINVQYNNLNSNDWEELFLSGFNEQNLNILCDEINNPFYHIRSYYANTTGSSNGAELAEGTSRFKSGWSTNDAQGYMEWFDSDIKSDKGWTVYPVGGMSEFVRRFYYNIIINDYADIYCGFNVEKIERNYDRTYNVYKSIYFHDEVHKNSPQYLIADKVIITVPVLPLHKIGGIIEQVSSSIFAKIWNPVDVLTCTQQFEDRWYENLIPNQFKLEENGDIDNITVDTWYSKENCMQQTENFNSDYLRSANVIRSLYVDESKCFEYWKSLIIGSNYDYEGVIANEIRMRHADYFGVDISDIPKPLSTRCDLSNQGWHYIGVGATLYIGNNPHHKIQDWSIQPLYDEDIFMCGETWALRHAWTDGCRANCDLMLHYALNVDTKYLKQWQFSLHDSAVCSSVCPDHGSDSVTCTQFPDEAILKDD